MELPEVRAISKLAEVFMNIGSVMSREEHFPFWRLSKVVAASLFVSGCSGTLAPIPMTSVSSSGVVLQGTLIPSMDFSGTFALASADGLQTCEGSTASDGQGTITCNDGQSARMTIPKPPYGQFNGSYVDTFPWGQVAVGWGNQADVAGLTGLLP